MYINRNAHTHTHKNRTGCVQNAKVCYVIYIVYYILQNSTYKCAICNNILNFSMPII